jgi:hypothetical protein
MQNCVATSNVTLKMNAMLPLGAIANVHDLCSGTNQCDDEFVCLRLRLSNDMMQSNVIAIVDFVLCHKSI